MHNTLRALAGGLVAALCGAFAGTATAAFPGVNGKIALSRDGQIVVKDLGDPTGGTALTNTGDNQDPAWSADGLRIAFVSDRGSGQQVWTMNADGTGQTPLTTESGTVGAPAWSPDGTRIAYSVDAGAGTDVVVRTLSGGRLVVAGGVGNQDLPVFSPDGSRVIFHDDSGGGLSIVGATGAGRASFLSDATSPDISPDGTRIVVRRTDMERLQVVNADGSGGTPILDFPATKPAWSPDGSRIIFHRSGFSGPASHLYTVPSGGAPAPTQDTTSTTLDFAPDWQPIGAVPVITGLPQALVAGAPGATLVVDGGGFAVRSVVRWNGADRSTTWVSPTRLTAQLAAADVAAPGTAQVTVFTSPSGGGLSAPATATVPAPPPPPPRILVTAARFSKVTWKRSRVRGTLRVTGTLERAGRVEVALLRGRRVAQRAVLKLPAGAFTRRIVLSRALLPGRYTLRLREVGTPSGLSLVATQRRVRLAAPPEGVVSRTFVSALLNGPPARTLRDKSRIFAHFAFAALPKGKRRITTTWLPPGPPTGTDVRPRTRLVTSFLTRRPELPAGTYRCELRVDGTLVAVASIRLR